MDIIRATKDDIGDIENLLYEVHAVHADARPDLFKKGLKKYSADEIASLMGSDSTPIYLYKKDGKLLGYAFVVYLMPKSDSQVHIKTMFVDDFCISHEARHMGIGSLIFHNLEEIARREDCYNITLNVYNFNEPAYRFYEKCGMHPLKTMMEKIL